MKNLTIGIDISIREAMKALDKTGEKCLLVVDNDKKLLGLRCMACGHETDGSDIEYCDGVEFTKNKIYFTTNYWNKLK